MTFQNLLIELTLRVKNLTNNRTLNDNWMEPETDDDNKRTSLEVRMRAAREKFRRLEIHNAFEIFSI